MPSRTSRFPWLAGACLLLVAGSPLSAVAADCEVDDLQETAPAGTTVTAATKVRAAGTMPEYCRVEAFVATPGNTVSFHLGLPAAWNNKFYFQGVGGFGGTIGSITGGIARGYASASTDTGHQAATNTDAAWALNHDAKRTDYAYRGTHVTAAAAKTMTAAYYGRALQHSYFNGCSNGGRQALIEAQRFPEDFDGIIAGDPSLGSANHVRRLMHYQAMLSSADRYLPPAKVDLMAKTVLATCDGRDGLSDGLIDDPRACTFLPEMLKCSAGDSADCLTAGQVETARLIYSDVVTPIGAVPGHAIGHEDGPTGWQQWITGTGDVTPRPDGSLAFGRTAPSGFHFQNGYFKYLAFEVHDPAFDWRTFSAERHGPALQPLAPMYSPTDPDLRPFQARGGKLLLYHGWADPAIPPVGTVDYYERAVAALGGREQADDAIRLFMAPGMQHCQGNGPGPNTFDALTALENWVERGTAPSRIDASHSTNGIVDRTRPLCAYPQVARYVGTGSVDAAVNFRCEPPTSTAPAP